MLAQSEGAPGFVELKAPDHWAEAPSASGIELSLRSGVRIRVAELFHEPTLKRLLVLLGV